MKTTIKTIKAIAKKYGATVTDKYGSQFRTLLIDSPQGKVWACHNEHCIRIDLIPGTPGVTEALKDGINRMEYGIEDCTDPECDMCHEEVN